MAAVTFPDLCIVAYERFSPCLNLEYYQEIVTLIRVRITARVTGIVHSTLQSTVDTS